MADDRAVFIQDRNYLCFINNCIFVRGGIILPVYSFEVVFQNDLFAGLYFSFQVFVDIGAVEQVDFVYYIAFFDSVCLFCTRIQIAQDTFRIINFDTHRQSGENALHEQNLIRQQFGHLLFKPDATVLRRRDFLAFHFSI